MARRVPEIAEPYQLQRAPAHPEALAGGHAAKLERQCDIFLRRQPRQQRRLLKHESEVGGGGLGRLAIDDQRAAAHRAESGDQPQQRRLAATARADQRNKFAGLRGERNPIEHERPVTKALGDIAKFDQRSRRHAP
jgi:hypothetical protein